MSYAPARSGLDVLTPPFPTKVLFHYLTGESVWKRPFYSFFLSVPELGKRILRFPASYALSMSGGF